MAPVAGTRHPVTSSYIVCAALLLVLGRLSDDIACAQPTFPTSGYNTILLDPNDAAIPDNVDLLKVGYQEDGTYGFLRITVVGTAAFASDRYYAYFDLDGDGLSDRRLRNTSAVGGTLESWSGSAWVSYGSGWVEDPDDVPDDHVQMACLLSDINAGDFTLKLGIADTANQDPTAREPWDDQRMGDWSGSSANPTGVEAVDFAVVRRGRAVRLSWRCPWGADARIVGFNIYRAAGNGGAKLRRVNARLIVMTGAETYSVVDKRHAAGTYHLEVVRPDGGRRIVAIVRWPLGRRNAPG